MPPKTKDEEFMGDATFNEILRRTDALIFQCIAFWSIGRIMPHDDAMRAVSGLETELIAFKDNFSLVKTRRTVDEARLSKYNGLYNMLLEELVASEGYVALLTEMLEAFEKLDPSSDRKNVALNDRSIAKGSEGKPPMEALTVLLIREIETIVQKINRQKTLYKLYRDVYASIDGLTQFDFSQVLKSALDEGHTEFARFLVANFEHDRGSYDLAFSEASSAGNNEIVHQKVLRLLLDAGADVNAQGGRHGNALMAASSAGHQQIVRLLLDKGADVNAQGGYYGNALHAASSAGHQQIVRLLLDNGADVNAQSDSYGSALLAASSAGHQEIVRFLIDIGADVNAHGGRHGNALEAASSAGHQQIVRLLLDKGADVNAQSDCHGGALRAASYAGHQEIVRYLIDKGADVNAQSRYNGDALQAASPAGHYEIVRLLLQNGADVNAQSEAAFSAIYAASLAGHQDIVHALLEFGSDANAQSHYGDAALHTASYLGREEIVRLLLKYGAAINALNHGRTALQQASSAGRHKTVQLLLEHGADLGDYDTARRMVQSASDKEVLQLLLEYGAPDVAQTKALRDNRPQKGNRLTLVREIAAWLLQNSLFRSLLRKALEGELRIDIFWDDLAQLIKRYGEDLVELTSEHWLLRAAGFLISHPWHIIWAIWSLNESSKSDQNNNSTKGQQERVAAFLNHQVATVDDNLDEVELELSQKDSYEVKRYLASKNAPLYSFLGSFCRLVYGDPLEAVRAELLRGVENRSECCRVQFELGWRIEEYFTEEIITTKSGPIDGQIIGSLLTISGDAHKCYANSCEMYMKWKWPHTYNVLLEAMALGCEGRARAKYRPKPASTDGLVAPGSVHYSIYPRGGDTIVAFGPQVFLIEIAQQLSWLTAAMRLPIKDQVSFSDSLLTSSDAKTDVAMYKILPLPLHRVPETDDCCWLPLFSGTVIARSYPIPERQQERGLELPFDLMATVAGTMVPKYHDGGIYLKGYSRLLYPVSGSIPGSGSSPSPDSILDSGSVPGSVQWHLVTSPSRRESLSDDLIFSQSWLRIFDPRILSNETRTFLGYCREVIIDLATDKTAYHYQGISFSGAKDAVHGPRIQAPTSLTLGTSGMGIFGATLNHSIVYGKTLVQTISGDNDDYLDVLDISSKTPIILYDDNNESRRAWMIPASIIILHMIRTWAADKNCFQGSLPCVAPQQQAEDATRSVLESAWNLVVRNSPDEDMCKNKTVKDLVMELWHGIQKRYNEDLIARHLSETGVDLISSKLYGWDYMDLVMGRPSCKKQLDFHGNWMDLTENVTVLFGGGFGDVIKPAPGTSICTEWNPIPPKKMHLTATIDCLKKLSRLRGHPSHLAPFRLTNKSYWNYHASNLFNDCTDCCSSTPTRPVKCLKMLQKLDSSAEKFSSELPIPSKGAIVFGKQPKALNQWSKMRLSKLASRIKPQLHQFQVPESGPNPTIACNNVYADGDHDLHDENGDEMVVEP